MTQRPQQVPRQHDDGNRLDECPDGLGKVQLAPAWQRVVGVRPTRHASQSEQVHREERQVEPDHHPPEDPPPAALVQQSASDLGEPVVRRSQDPKQRSTTKHVVEVRDDVVGVVRLPVQRHRREVDSGQSTDRKLQHERERVEHRDSQVDATTPQGREPREHFDARRHRNGHAGQSKERVGNVSQTDGEHVVRPDGDRQEGDGDARGHDDAVAKQRFARKDRDDLRDDPEGRQRHDVHLGVTEVPEQVLPQDGIAPGSDVEKVRSQMAVNQQHGLRGRE